MPRANRVTRRVFAARNSSHFVSRPDMIDFSNNRNGCDLCAISDTIRDTNEIIEHSVYENGTTLHPRPRQDSSWTSLRVARR